uniref:C2 domain-containing protein n=2 Tax=Cairina moschata TaxID=8855 RepID=A0A8C3GLU0_CAIMO
MACTIMSMAACTSTALCTFASCATCTIASMSPCTRASTAPCTSETACMIVSMLMITSTAPCTLAGTATCTNISTMLCTLASTAPRTNATACKVVSTTARTSTALCTLACTTTHRCNGVHDCEHHCLRKHSLVHTCMHNHVHNHQHNPLQTCKRSPTPECSTVRCTAPRPLARQSGRVGDGEGVAWGACKGAAPPPTPWCPPRRRVAMSGDYEEDVCRSALRLVQELCFAPRARAQHQQCLEFTDLLRHRGHPRPADADISVSLLSVIVTFCGIVLLGVSLFVSWKLCWVPWRDKGGAGAAPRKEPPHPTPFGEPERGEAGAEAPERSYLDMGSCPEAALKLSQTSPELPLERDGAGGALPSATSQQQVAALGHGGRHPPAPRPSSPDPPNLFEEKPEQSTSIGQIQPELYQPGEGDARRGGTGGAGGGTPCGRLSVALRYAYGTEQLVVRVLRARDLPAKDANGFSDPYVKMYLLPDRKKKFQTKVHRRTLNPVFDETFSFGVPFAELPARRLHFSVYDFDRFSRHDLIGQVVLDNLLEAAERDGETPIWRDILEATAEKADLGEVNFSLCYLPTAGRLTVTVIRASNLRAMDLTGFSDPYVKASLMAEGRRLKKRKTSIKKNTLNPSYNEALVFDVPHESVHHVSLTIAVVDYDCIGHNEVIGMCRVGSDAEGPGREHWAEMLANPRKPIEHWHTLVEVSLSPYGCPHPDVGVPIRLSLSPYDCPRPHMSVPVPI